MKEVNAGHAQAAGLTYQKVIEITGAKFTSLRTSGFFAARLLMTVLGYLSE